MNDKGNDVINQYLTFTLGKDRYAINILNAREVLETVDLTRVPRMPEFMCGVINLRGSVVPVIDLKIKFKMDNNDESNKNNIIVTEINDPNGDDELLTIGIYADSVQKVLTIEPENIGEVPKIGIPINTEFINGIGKINNDFIILLNINKILSSGDFIISEEVIDDITQ